MDARRRAELLRGWAREEGFDRAGVARLGPAAHGDAYLRWLERGDQAAMGWMERRRDVRLDPRRHLDGAARSALCVALHYHPLAGEDEPEGDLWPRVARYARGLDYHDLMAARLRRLGRRVEEAFPGARSHSYVDTGPVLERDLAAAAGLGAIGKNTNLLDPDGGSWFLVGELLLTLDLAPDAPLADLCGSCTRCLEACPTGALPEAYRLDARRCISFWTIEHRGAVPAEVRPLLDDWVFGCDICQEVCPVGAAAPPAEHHELRLPPERRELDLAGLLGLDRAAYVERFRGSPMKRAKLPGLKRNAALAMGNRRRPEHVAPLARALTEEAEPVVRGAAAWALGRIGDAAAREALGRAAPAESDPAVAAEIAAALAACGSTAGPVSEG